MARPKSGTVTWKEADYWTLCHKTIKVPDVTWIFWNAMNGNSA